MMTRKRLAGLVVLGVLAVVPSRASAATIGVFELVSPTFTPYTLGVPTGDWMPLGESPLGEVTGALQAVDLLLPSPGGSTSGCDAADFAGFVPGRIALIQRGTCTFQLKALNAFAAGAAAALIFNEGDLPIRTDVIRGTVGPSYPAPMMAIFLSFAVGEDLAERLAAGESPVVHLRIDENTDPITVIPEPATLVLLGTGLLAASRRRRKR